MRTLGSIEILSKKVDGYEKIPGTKAFFPESSIKQISQSVEEVLRSGYLSNGSFTRNFEAEWSKRLGRACIAVCNGTSALELAFRLGRISGKEVIIPASTIYLDAFAAERAGAEVKFTDVDPKNGCLRLEDVEARASRRIGGICVTHLGGIVTPQIKDIRKLCDENDWFLLEDAAHAHGSTHEGRPGGTFGHAAAFSFFNTKVVTCGEGGLVAFEDSSAMKEANMIADQGLYNEKNEIEGGNMRMSELSACVGLEQTRLLDGLIRKRSEIAAIYDKELAGSSIRPVKPPEGSTSNYYKYSVLVPEGLDRNELKKTMKEKHDIPMPGGIYYTPCHLQPVWRGRYMEGDFPGAEEWARRHLCLPLQPQMDEKQAPYVAEKLKEEIFL
ncbi:MAG: DegT/DnrJ/EryC1/StrS family aminotransferase [Candidatus Micrarchaeota archaeon]